MNGDSIQLYSKFKEDFAILKTQSDERWDAHRVTSQNIADEYCRKFNDINKTLTYIASKIDKLPCHVHFSDIQSNTNKVAILEKLVLVVILVGIVIGVWVKYANVG